VEHSETCERESILRTFKRPFEINPLHYRAPLFLTPAMFLHQRFQFCFAKICLSEKRLQFLKYKIEHVPIVDFKDARNLNSAQDL
jgi:hypothetical protein